MKLWRKFVAWLYSADETEEMFHRLDVIEERLAALEAAMSITDAPEEKTSRRGSEWDVLS